MHHQSALDNEMMLELGTAQTKERQLSKENKHISTVTDYIELLSIKRRFADAMVIFKDDN